MGAGACRCSASEMVVCEVPNEGSACRDRRARPQSVLVGDSGPAAGGAGVTLR